MAALVKTADASGDDIAVKKHFNGEQRSTSARGGTGGFDANPEERLELRPRVKEHWEEPPLSGPLRSFTI